MDETSAPEAAGANYAGDLFEEPCVKDAARASGRRSRSAGPLGKYAPLALHLKRFDGNNCMLTFSEVEEIIGSPLPSTACRRRTGWLWWSNDATRTQARNGWLAVGWYVSNVEYDKCRVNWQRGA